MEGDEPWFASNRVNDSRFLKHFGKTRPAIVCRIQDATVTVFCLSLQLVIKAITCGTIDPECIPRRRVDASSKVDPPEKGASGECFRNRANVFENSRCRRLAEF